MIIRRASPKDASAIAGVHVATWRATYAGIVPHEYLASLSAEQRSRFWGERIENPGPSACLFVATTPQEELLGLSRAVLSGPRIGSTRARSTRSTFSPPIRGWASAGGCSVPRRRRWQTPNSNLFSFGYSRRTLTGASTSPLGVDKSGGG
jgi:hypothetical protein